MKISIDVSQIVYEGTGVANYTRDLVSHLVKKDRKNDYLLFGYSLRRKEVIDKFFEELKSYNNNLLFRSFRIPEGLANFIWNDRHIFALEHLVGSSDIYHSSDWIQIPSKARKITTVHDLIIYKYPQTSAPTIIATQKKRLSHAVRECRIILADSNSTKDDLVKILNFPKNDINVVYPGINSAFRNISPRMTKKIIGQYHISSPYFLTVGTKEPRKNIKRIINAFNKFIQQSYFKEIKNPPILVIAGNAGWGETITGDKRIKVIGKIDSQDLPALYSASISLVYPSLYEGFGLPVLEAFACGAPVICSNRGSLKEVAQDAAYIVDPVKEDDITKAMLKIFTDRSLRDKLINKGLTRSKFFSWDNAVRGVLSSYNQLLNK